MNARPASGAGLGFRRELIEPLKAGVPEAIRFFELAPENWAGHGRPISQGSAPLHRALPFCLPRTVALAGRPGAAGRSSAAPDQGVHGRARHDAVHRTPLMVLATTAISTTCCRFRCTEKAVKWTVDRISRAQDILGMRIGIENASYYVAPPGAEMSEGEFISAIVREGRLPAAPRRQQHLRQQPQLRLRRARLHATRCRWNAPATSMSPAITSSRTACSSTPMAPKSSTPCGRCSKQPTSASARYPPAWSATSIFPIWGS